MGVEEGIKRERHTAEQFARMLRELDRLLGWGTPMAGMRKHLEVTETTFCRWLDESGA